MFVQGLRLVTVNNDKWRGFLLVQHLSLFDPNHVGMDQSLLSTYKLVKGSDIGHQWPRYGMKLYVEWFSIFWVRNWGKIKNQWNKHLVIKPVVTICLLHPNVNLSNLKHSATISLLTKWSDNTLRTCVVNLHLDIFCAGVNFFPNSCVLMKILIN